MRGEGLSFHLRLDHGFLMWSWEGDIPLNPPSKGDF